MQRDARRPPGDAGPSTSSTHFSAECVIPLSKDMRRKFGRGNKYDITDALCIFSRSSANYLSSRRGNVQLYFARHYRTSN